MRTKNKPTKKQESQIKLKVLKLYLDGHSQEEIQKQLEDQFPAKKLKTIVKENAFLSPKSFRLGAILLFFLTLLTPPITVYIRGYEYRNILDDIMLISIIFSAPFILLGLGLYITKDLKKLRTGALALIFYLVIYILVFVEVSREIKIWTLVLFPLILLPTFVGEYWKLQTLMKQIEKKSKKD